MAALHDQSNLNAAQVQCMQKWFFEIRKLKPADYFANGSSSCYDP